jgi:hypothetical protein
MLTSSNWWCWDWFIEFRDFINCAPAWHFTRSL